MTTGTFQPDRFDTEVMQQVADHACRLKADGHDIVFTAAVAMDGTVLARARNEVGDTGDVSRHAEVVALAEAAGQIEGRSLKGATLYASCQPCEMCLSAMRWAEVDRVVFAARQENAGAAYFRFYGLKITDFHAACDGAFDWAGGVCEADVLHIYAEENAP